MIKHSDIVDAQGQQLFNIKNQLIVEKMKLDKFFSKFLDANEMDEEDTTTPEWFTYKEMLKDYERVNKLIKSADYYIAHRT